MRSFSDCQRQHKQLRQVDVLAALQGVLLNPLTPEWLQTALLSVLLVVVVRKTYAKGFKQLHEEQKAGKSHQ